MRFLLIRLRGVMVHKAADGIAVLLHKIRGQVFQHRLPGVKCQASLADIDKSRQLKGIRDHMEHPLLFPDGFRDVRPRNADPGQTQVHRRDRDVLGADAAV